MGWRLIAWIKLEPAMPATPGGRAIPALDGAPTNWEIDSTGPFFTSVQLSLYSTDDNLIVREDTTEDLETIKQREFPLKKIRQVNLESHCKWLHWVRLNIERTNKDEHKKSLTVYNIALQLHRTFTINHTFKQSAVKDQASPYSCTSERKLQWQV